MPKSDLENRITQLERRITELERIMAYYHYPRRPLEPWFPPYTMH